MDEPRRICRLPQRAEASDAMARILDVAPPLVAGPLGGTRLTPTWRHGPLDADFGAMGGHLVATHRGPGAIRIKTAVAAYSGRAEAGGVSLIPEGIAGRIVIDDEVQATHVYLADDRLQRCATEHFDRPAARLAIRAGAVDEVGAGILNLLARQASALGDPSTRLVADAAIDLLCIHLIAAHSEDMPNRTARRQGLASWQVRRATAFMRAHLAEPVSLDDLAAEVWLSRFHVCTAFRKATGATPHQWLTRERIRAACELLADPGRTVTDVALDVGYATPSAFAAAFHRVTGTTPTDFRTRHAAGHRHDRTDAPLHHRRP